MTLKEARELREYIHSKCSVNCTVPLGFGPTGYNATTILRTGPHRWLSRAEFREWLAGDIRERRKINAAYLAATAPPRRRSPIEMMIDQACGLG